MSTPQTAAKVTLLIHIADTNDVKSVMFEETMLVCYACSFVREKFLPSSNKDSSANEYGLFKPDEEIALWLNMGKTIKDYELHDGDTLQYKKKIVPYSVIMPYGSMQKIKLDHSRSTAENVKMVCSEAGLPNYYEYSFEVPCLPNSLKSAKKHDQKSNKKPSSGAKSLWLKTNKTFAEQGLDENCVLTLKKKFCISDTPLPQGDSNALNLVYDQCKDAIINGSHPCTESEAIQLAALQCYVKFGKDKPASIKLSEFLPVDYATGKDIEQSVRVAHSKLNDMTELECKTFYIQLCRSLPTYAATFFLVNEKRKGTKKLVPTLLGFKPSSVMRVDKVTKQVIASWPLRTVRRWVGTEEFFKIDFGAASELVYSAQTTEGHAISDFISDLTSIMDEIRFKSQDDNNPDNGTKTAINTTCGTEGDLETGTFDDTQFPSQRSTECPSPKAADYLSPKVTDSPLLRRVNSPSQSSTDSPSRVIDSPVMDCPSPRSMDCSSPMPAMADLGNRLQVTASDELQNRDSASTKTGPPSEEQKRWTPLHNTTGSGMGPIINSDLLGSGYFTLPLPHTKPLGKELEPADIKQEVQRLQTHVVRLQLDLQMSMDQVKYAEQRAELAEKRAALAEERARKAEQSFRLSWQMTNQ